MAISDVDRLERVLSGPGNPPKIKKRASIINLYLTTDKSAKEIADSLDLSKPTVYRWLYRFNREGLETIFDDRPRSGRPRKTEKDYYVLTEREREILRWIAGGKTSWEISRIIQISPKTVDNHVSSITEKFGVSNRTAAVAEAIRIREI